MQLFTEQPTDKQLRLFEDVQADIVNPQVWSKLITRGVVATMARLWPHHHGRVVVAVYVLGSMGAAGATRLKNSEIASDLGMPIGTVRRHLYSAVDEGILAGVYKTGKGRHRIRFEPGLMLRLLVEDLDLARPGEQGQGGYLARLGEQGVARPDARGVARPDARGVARPDARGSGDRTSLKREEVKREEAERPAAATCRRSGCDNPVDVDAQGVPYPLCRGHGLGIWTGISPPRASGAGKPTADSPRCPDPDCRLPAEYGHVEGCPQLEAGR